MEHTDKQIHKPSTQPKAKQTTWKVVKPTPSAGKIISQGLEDIRARTIEKTYLIKIIYVVKKWNII